MLQGREKRLAPPKRVMTMAFAASLAHGGSNRQLAVAAASDGDIEDPMALNRLVTTFESDHSSAGAMFDIKAKNPVIIRGMDINTIVTTDDARIEIWTKEGSYKGSEKSVDAWTLWMNDTIVGKGKDAVTSIPPEDFAPVTVSANEMRAFYIAFPDGAYMRYITSERLYYINEDLILYGNGAAKRMGFEGGALPSRTFSGALRYETITPEPTPVPSVRPSDQPTEQPTSAPIETKALTTTFENSVSYAGNMFDVGAKGNIQVSSIAFNTFLKDDITVQLYTREGSFSGFEDDLLGWEFLCTVTVQGQGLGNPTFIPEGAFPPVLVRRKNTQAFYITSDGPNLRSARGTSQGRVSSSNADIEVYEGIGKRYPMNVGTFTPRVWNGVLEYQVIDIPTPAPTVEPTLSPTLSPTPRPTMSNFRLRLYWDRNYYWQETSRETFWCMQCSGRCREGESIYVDWCGSSSRQQFTTIGDTIRPVSDSSLCLTNTGHSEERPIRLSKCDDNSGGVRNGMGSNSRSDQQFFGLKEAGRFELKPKGESGNCLTQAHHPKPFERVFSQNCRVARNHDTAYWILF